MEMSVNFNTTQNATQNYVNQNDKTFADFHKITNPPTGDTVQFSQTSDSVNNKKGWKKRLKNGLITLGLAHIALAGGIALALVFGKKGVSFKSIQKSAKAVAGNNNMLDDVSKKSMEAVDEMIKAGKSDYEKILEKAKQIIKPLDKKFLPEEGIVYHGTNLEGADNIVKKGITPYISGEHGREFGAAVYTTPDSRVADFFATNCNYGEGIIMPFRLKTDKIAHMTEDGLMQINTLFIDFYKSYISRTNYFKEEGVELPQLADALFANFLPLKNVKFAHKIQTAFLNKLFKDSGYEAAFMEKAVTGTENPLFGQTITNALEKEKGILQSQFAVFDGTKLELIPEMIRKGQPV